MIQSSIEAILYSGRLEDGNSFIVSRAVLMHRHLAQDYLQHLSGAFVGEKVEIWQQRCGLLCARRMSFST